MEAYSSRKAILKFQERQELLLSYFAKINGLWRELFWSSSDFDSLPTERNFAEFWTWVCDLQLGVFTRLMEALIRLS